MKEYQRWIGISIGSYTEVDGQVSLLKKIDLIVCGRGKRYGVTRIDLASAACDGCLFCGHQ